MKFPLSKPIQIGDAPEISELTLREEICAGDLRGIKLAHLADMPTDDLLKIVGRLSGKTDAEMNKLSVNDLVALGGIVTSFLGGGTPDGKTSSP